MVVVALLFGIFGLAITGLAVRFLRWLYRIRKLSDVTGTVVGRDRQFTGKGYWTYPVVEFTTRDGIQIRRTFQQLARPRIGRKLRIVYDPNMLQGSARPGTGTSGPVFEQSPSMIYSIWLLLWIWSIAAFGLGLLTLSIAVLAGAGDATF